MGFTKMTWSGWKRLPTVTPWLFAWTNCWLSIWRATESECFTPADLATLRVITFVDSATSVAGDAIVELRRLLERYAELAPLRDEGRLETAVLRIGSEDPGGWLYAGLDDRDLLQGAGHYLIYGSEFLAGILAFGDGSAQQVLRREGIPTVFIIDVSVGLIPASDMRQLARQLLAQWGCNVVRGHYSAPLLDFSFAFKCDIPVACIAGHYHPKKHCRSTAPLSPLPQPSSTLPKVRKASRISHRRVKDPVFKSWIGSSLA
jgi:hypothetical protein